MNKGQKVVAGVVGGLLLLFGLSKLVKAQPPGGTKYTLVISSGAGGSTNPAPGSYLYDAGAQATITATPAAGYDFGGWSGSITSTVNPAAITMNGNKAVQANFVVSGRTPIDINWE